MRALAVLLLSLPSILVGCTGATFGSGVGDAVLERPPYYAGRSVQGDGATMAHLPIAYQRGAAQAPIFEPEGGEGTPLARLLGEMNAYLDSIAPGARLLPPAGTPPDVRFGCATDAAGDCDTDPELAGDSRNPKLHLAVGRPSETWVAGLRTALDGAGAARALVLTLEIANYPVHQTGWRGDKEVQLGTGHTVRLPWLTSLETPVSVLQLTGAVVDTAGKAVRIGAEGLLARRTSFTASTFGVQALISDAEVEELRAARREDLPGEPLVWQVALRTLVGQLGAQ